MKRDICRVLKKKYPNYQNNLLDSLTKEITQGYMLSFISEIKDQQTARFPTREKDLAHIKNKYVLRSQLPWSYSKKYT
jgi:hypothetical protein